MPVPSGTKEGSARPRPSGSPGGIPEYGADPAAAAAAVRLRLRDDTEPVRNLATFLTTSFEPEAQRLHNAYLNRNLADREQYPGVDELVRECVRMLGHLWGGDPNGVVGSATTGSSEAAMMAGLSLLHRWAERTGPGNRRPNLVMGAGVHACWRNFCRHWEVEPRVAPARPGCIGLDAGSVAELCDESTIGVVTVLGGTLDGRYEPVREITEELDRVAAESGIEVPVHVDAAGGGFIAPFLDPDLAWGFDLPRVVSINASGHKYGQVPPGLGWVLWRDRDHRSRRLGFPVNYLGSNHTYHEFSFSRSAAPVVLQYYNFIRYGFAGYRSMHARSRILAQDLAARLRGTGRFHFLGDGRDLPVVAVTAEPDLKLAQLAAHLGECGWSVPVYQLPPDLDELTAMRVVVRSDLRPDEVVAFAAAVDEFTRSTK
ncbi:glutamate decarboxylase [Saccharopolyspora sp. NPDC002686]|uniref:glutamate decarboxylase n=1 Tax=Saccharopolyspora sp. NPDC002686 TaxID=3154541 RepID=UPI0033297464